MLWRMMLLAVTLFFLCSGVIMIHAQVQSEDDEGRFKLPTDVNGPIRQAIGGMNIALGCAMLVTTFTQGV